MLRLSLILATSLFPVNFAIPTQKPDLTSSLEQEITALHQANTANERYKILGADGLAFSFLDADSFDGGGKGQYLTDAGEHRLLRFDL
jgi:hypothetical protein